jgi:hypothetical protein
MEIVTRTVLTGVQTEDARWPTGKNPFDSLDVIWTQVARWDSHRKRIRW